MEVMISELGESSMVVRITVGAPNPDIAFQIKSHVQEHLLDYLNRFKQGSLIGAVADPKPAVESQPANTSTAMAATTTA